MLTFLITVFKIIFILGFLVLIHEGGHFLVARLCKIRVNEFAIGFGPTIWKKQGKETKYAIRLIPLGGFVNMEGEEERSEEEGSFSMASIPKRIAVVAAGGLVNIIFALITYFILMASLGNNVSTVVDSTIPNQSAEAAGIISGDKITKINNKTIRNKTDFDQILEECNGEPLDVEVERNGEKLQFTITPTAEAYNYTGIAVKYTKSNPTTEIVTLDPNSPAEVQGLLPGDIITKVNGEDVKGNPQKLLGCINKSDKLNFEIERGNENIEITVEPQVRYDYYLGVYLQRAENNFANNMYYAFWDTGDFAFSIIDNLKLLFSGGVSVNQLMGPVGIGEVVAETNGVADFVYILALISISLGVTNLLPFPPLDGGKIVLLLLEAIRRKPLKQETEIKIQMVGFMLLIGLSIYVAYNDILRIF